jgi:hypothetical protein
MKPSWCIFDLVDLILTITPPTGTTGTFIVSFDVSDPFNIVPNQFNIIVQPNNPPYFSSALSTQTVTEGTSITYCLPSIIDPESDACSIHNIYKPSWCSFDYTLKCFTISPPLG